MLRGVLIVPVHFPKFGLETSSLKALPVPQVPPATNRCQFHTLKNSPRTWKVTFSAILVSLINAIWWP